MYHAVKRLAASLLAVLLMTHGVAAQGKCLGQGPARAAIASGAALPLAVALANAGISPGMVAKARLCRGGRGLEYRLTLNNGRRVAVRAR